MTTLKFYVNLLNGIVIIAVIIIVTALIINPAPALDYAILKGSVTDVDGNAVKGAELFIYRTSDTRRPADFISAGTDNSGQYTMTVPAGKWWAVARMRTGEKYGPLAMSDRHSGEPIEIELAAGRELDMAFKIADIREAARLVRKTREDYFRVTGRIIDNNGVPAANVYAIAARSKDMPEVPAYVSAWTDETGEYTLYLPAGEYYTGYARVFPPPSAHHMTGKVTIEGERNNYDIRP
ncbi:MAG: carboxypeptidase regulatory-like domain-containing protein [Nitrospiraceae bacterium]|nr:MAG: carboxypeptidase regulatory-like domain-containing protein [Nitrospiraceae bacterium]